MSDLHRSQLEEQYLDASLLLFMDEYAESQGKQLLEDYLDSGIQMPEQLDNVCQALILTQQKKSEKDILLRRTARRASKAAVVALVCLLLCANLVLSVEALRVPFLNFCFDARRYFSSLSFQTEEQLPSDSSDDTISLPISAPAGYRISMKQHNYDDYSLIREDSTLFLGYQDEAGHTLMIQTLPAAGSFSIDTEDAEATRFLLNGMQAIHIRQEEDGMLRTIWIDPERQRLFDVSCNGLSDADFEQYIYELSGMFMSPTLYAD